MTIWSHTISSWVTSCRFAPLTTSDKGTPRPSTNKFRWLPFSPIGWIRTDCFWSQGSFYKASVGAWPFPADSLHFIIFSQSSWPKSNQKTTFRPAKDSTRTAKTFLWQGFLPPPGWPRYFLFGSSLGDGITGLTLFQNEADTCHGFTLAIRPPCYMVEHGTYWRANYAKCQFIYG